MSTIHSFAEAVQFAARCVECPICKEACVQPVRPKNCPHRYCMRCFRKCFQDKQEKHCATCRTPILSVSKRGFTEDDLFARVADIVPGIRDEEEEEDFDIAAIMAKQQQQAAKIRQEAQQMRNTAGDNNPRSTKHSGAVQSNSQVQPKKGSLHQHKAAASSPTAKQSRAQDNLDSSNGRNSRKPSLPPLGSHYTLPTHPATTSLAVPVSTVPSSSMGMNGQQFAVSQAASAGFDMGTNGSGASTSMNAPFVDTRGMLGNGSLPDMHGMAQPASKRAKVGNMILPAGSHQEPAGVPLRDHLVTSALSAGSLGPMELLQGCNSFERPAAPVAKSAALDAPPRGSDLLRESLHARVPSMQKTVVVYARVPATASEGGALTPLTCEWDSALASCIAQAALPQGGDLGALAAALRMTMDVDGNQHDVTLKTAGEAALLAREHVVVEVSGMPSGLWIRDDPTDEALLL